MGKHVKEKQLRSSMDTLSPITNTETSPPRYCDPVESGGGVITPVDCPEGSFCPVNTTSQLHHPCPPGTFSNATNLQDDTQCTPCTGGSYCGSPGRHTVYTLYGTCIVKFEGVFWIGGTI